MADTYKVGYNCDNCNASYNYDVPKGTTVEDFAEKTPCRNCQVKKLLPQKETFLE